MPAESRIRQWIGLRPGVRVVPAGDATELHHPWGRHTLRGLRPDDLDRLRVLTERSLEDVDLPAGQLRTALLSLPNLIAVTLTDLRGRALVVATPISRCAGILDVPLVHDAAAQLSRFAYLRRLPDADTGLALESPLSAHRLTFPDPRIGAFVAALVGSSSIAETADRVGVDRHAASLVVSVLAAAGFLATGRDERLTLWEFHDLLFHTRSRYGLHDYQAGGVFAHAELPHEPALLVRDTDPAVDLAVPEWGDVIVRDATLTQVLEGRRSLRTYQPEPITVDQLGELLYRTARARRLVRAGGDHGYDGVDRPYPLGGGLGELEIYLAVHRCEGLPAGMYWYDSAAHRLLLRNTDPAVRMKLAQQAWLATGGQVTDPQIQFCITSRVSRVQWKYSAIAYAVTLKHVGVLMQTLYLVATAMHLSPCANGSGDTELMARAICVDWAEEPPVGEFLLGGHPAEAPPAAREFVDMVEPSRAGRRG